MSKIVTWLRANAIACVVACLILFVVIVVGKQAIQQKNSAPSQTSNSSQVSHAHNLGAIPGQMPKCGSPLWTAGYSVTTSVAYAPNAIIGTAQLQPEFTALSSRVPLDSARGLTRMYIAHDQTLPHQSINGDVQQLSRLPNVTFAEPIYLQSSDPKYLSCFYRLQDNPQAQAVAQKARDALVQQGVSAAFLDAPGTVEYISLRHFGGKSMLQVAFVSLPAEMTPAPLAGSTPEPTAQAPQQPKGVYVAIMDPTSLTVIDEAKANWYN